jgi:Spy/CpxP family protein refolding chaperone
MSLNLTRLMILVVVTVALVVPAAHARHAAEGGFGHKGCPFSKEDGDKGGLDHTFFHKAHFILDHADELGLSEKQTEEIKNLKVDTKKNLIRQEAEIDILALDIKQRMYGPSIDTKAVNELVDQKYELKKAKAKSSVEAIAKLKQSLSEEQYKKMKETFKSKK